MRRTLVAISIAVAGAVALLGAQPPHASAAEGFDQTASTVYRLDPAKGVLRVTVTLKVTNHTPDTNEPYTCVKYGNDWLSLPYLATCYRTTRYFLNTTSAAVENEAASVRAVSGSRQLKVTLGPKGAWYRGVTIAIPELFYGKTRTVKLTYTVKGGAPRSESPTRTMRAYASFCVIANGNDSGSVTVRIPKGFTVDTTGDKVKSKVAGAERVFSSGAIKRTSDWFACFTGTNRAGFRTEKLAAPDGRSIALRSWPEDPAWAKGVRADLTASLPLLERLTGTGMTGEGSLSIQESSTGTEYAGFYDQDSNTVTVGEDFRQPSLVEHELAHVWFNGSAFADTWLSEGYAEWAGRTVGAEETGCSKPDAAQGTIGLATWRYLEPRSTQEERAAVADQYQAACHVVTAVASAAGEERMTAAVAALLGRRDPYAADASAKRAARTATWKDWLDAVDELALAPAGAPEGLASDLLVEYGVTADRALLAKRASARRAFHALLATVDGWTVPPVVRAPLAAWKFSDAGAAIESAGRTWELTGQTDDVLDGVDARHGPAADAWQHATTLADLEAAADLAGRQLTAARDVADALSLVGQPLDVVQQVGLFGTQIPTPDAAIPAVRSGDGDAAARVTAEVRATINGLRATGQQRIALGGTGGLVLLLLLAALLLKQARATSRRRAEARLAAATVAVAEAHPNAAAPDAQVQQRASLAGLDDDETEVWDVPIIASDPDPDLGSLVRSAPPPAEPSRPPEPSLPPEPPPPPPRTT